MRIYKLEKKTIQKDTTIRLKFVGGSWATMTFTRMENDWTNVSIDSDWGKWSYGWGDSGIKSSGPCIFNFMSDRADQGYFKSKFIGAEKELFDAKKTCTNFRKIVRENYPWIDSRYRDQNESLMMEIKDLESCETEDDFVRQLHPDLSELCGGEWWHYMAFRRHPRTRIFFDKIYPKFIPEIRKLAREQKKNREQAAKEAAKCLSVKTVTTTKTTMKSASFAAAKYTP